ncbi:hypothetical protein [Salinirubrum litoreum]|uniref:Uncharacterized protein n=1 Tax=Salinirubrum litoreum TaxID=1126234 RepID=A0ABD5RAX6_9EURY|nr:hypothetical protein [Salinirubrum litoreum]
MTEKTPPNQHRLTIQLDIADLPAGETPEQYVDGLTSELREALQDAGRTVPRASGWVGPFYASLPADCPDCGTLLEIDRPHLDEQNGALAHATCPDDDCGWSGDAEYCLIDLSEFDDKGRAHSLVRAGRLTPTFEEY